jgi:large subunit ribosomal protein L18
MAKTSKKLLGRYRRHGSIRKSLSGTADRPRLVVFRSANHIYAQIINDELENGGVTLASASSLVGDVNGGNIEGAKVVGLAIAKAGLAANIKAVVFDRNGFRYHGRVAALADSARQGGLEF